jgi:CubicO group peptidase (beta-lactamase class C family)
MKRVLAAVAAFFALGAFAQPLPTASPESVGFSSEGLARIDRFFEREIDANRVPGAVVAIARDGRLVYYKAFGVLDKATGERMPLDAVFNLASMTKPMTAVGALVLTEEGRLPLKSRVDQYLPAFAQMKVGSVSSAGEIALEPVKQPIFVHDLYRHTSGLTYGGRANTAVHKLYPAGSAPAAAAYTSEEFLAKLTGLPLLYQPGTVWDYGFSTDVLGLVVEKVTNRPLGDHLKATVWDRVRMPDTTFELSPEQRKRLARPFAKDPLTGQDQRILPLERPMKFQCGGSCAWSTVGDYLRFGQMLLDGGAIDGRRVLSPMSVVQMTSDHLGTQIRNQVAGTEPQREGYGFGFAVAVRVHDGIAAVPGSKGDYTWNGANGTLWWNDPQERLVVVAGTAAPGELRKYYREQMAALVYGAMTELRARR